MGRWQSSNNGLGQNLKGSTSLRTLLSDNGVRSGDQWRYVSRWILYALAHWSSSSYHAKTEATSKKQPTPPWLRINFSRWLQIIFSGWLRINFSGWLRINFSRWLRINFSRWLRIICSRWLWIIFCGWLRIIFSSKWFRVVCFCSWNADFPAVMRKTGKISISRNTSCIGYIYLTY